MQGPADSQSGRGPSSPHIVLGKQAEDLAASHLEARGYLVIERNFRCRYGEIDLVARHGDTIVFVEVRARRSARQGEPFETVGPRKQQRLSRLAEVWLARHGLSRVACRFDVVSVLLPEGQDPRVEVIVNAFEAWGI